MLNFFHKKEDNSMKKVSKKQKSRDLETPIELTPEMEEELTNNKGEEE